MKKYQAPKVEVVEISPDGILCQSGLELIYLTIISVQSV